uniref:Reverse transcriptase domain-containing protein n=1 Tax=Tanacetum cinerariifolium TaxID=118510 RepID=A0A6L2KTX3_TANCI|nr:reverse transcriptase domain-containing protein [Tanacetum cinerariifolium]
MAQQRQVPSKYQLVPVFKKNDLALANIKIDITIPHYPQASKILGEILRRHPLCFALTASALVPWIYIEQVWHTLKLDDSKEKFMFFIDEKDEKKGTRNEDSGVVVNEGDEVDKELQGISIKEYEAQQAMKKVDEHLMDEDIEKLVEGEEIDVDRFANDMMNSQEDLGTRIDPGSHKENLETKKVVDYMSIDEEVKEESAEEKIQEFTASKPTSSLSKHKINCSKHIKGVIARMSKRYGCMFCHMKKSFMTRKDIDAIGKTVQKTPKVKEKQEKNKIETKLDKNGKRGKAHQFQEDPPEVPMADNRTMAQLLHAPTEGYEDAIVIPEIAATNFELKHGLINLVQNKQFFGHDKEDPHAHIRYFNKITSTMRQRFDESFNEACDRFNDLLRACSHHRISELHQLDTFYNALKVNDQDS